MRLTTRLLFALLLALALPVHAQDDETWHFASLPPDFGLVAYTTSGEVVTLIEAGVLPEAGGWRLDERTALAALEVDGASGIYLLSPDGAQPVEIAGIDLPADFVFDPPVLLAKTGGYAAFVDTPMMMGSAPLLLDIEAGTLTFLATLTVMQMRFDAEGAVLRYFAGEERESDEWALVERDLATGDETVIFENDGTTPFGLLLSASATDDGEHWLVFLSEQSEFLQMQINADGTTTEYAIDTVDASVVRGFFGDVMVATSRTCEAGCAVELRSLNDEPLLSFDAPTTVGFSPMARPTETSLLALLDSEWYLLSVDEPPLRLGAFEPGTVLSSLPNMLSPDGRYLIVPSGGTGQVRVWDTVTREVVVNHTVQFGVSPQFYDGYFLLQDANQEASLYFNEMVGVVELPSERGEIYFEALPDGVLFSLRREELAGDDELGIYVYDIASGDERLLVEGAFPMGLGTRAAAP